MTKTQTKPQFVNLQPTAVQVYDESRHAITVLPWGMRGKNPNGRYVVEGLHYQQFVGGRGPLYPFPVDANNPPGPLGETEDSRHARLVSQANQRTQVEGLQASANRGKIRIAGDVVRQGEVVGETQEAFAARLRPLLFAAGYVDADAFRKAPHHDLLKVAGITADNLARVREMSGLLYGTEHPEPEEPELPDPSSSADADEETLNTYSKKAIDRLGRAKLVEIIKNEGFELSVEGTAAEIRERLLAGLVEYKMLID